MENEPNAFVRFNQAADRRRLRIAITKIIIITSTIVIISAIAGYYNVLGN